MNTFIRQSHRPGESYTKRLVFAISIAARLTRSVVAFALHAIFPFIDIHRSLDLEATARFIRIKIDRIENEHAR